MTGGRPQTYFANFGSRTLALMPLRSAPVTPFTRRILIRIGGFLRRAQPFRHIAQVNSDAGPGGRPAAHGVDQHVVHGEKHGHFGMFTLPAFETGEGRFSVRRVSDHQKWRPGPWLLHGGFFHRSAGARRGPPGRFALHLTKVWRPGSVAETCRLVFRRELEQL